MTQRPVSNQSEIEKLQADIERLKHSQEVMRAANAALGKGDDGALRDLGFTDEHIADLKRPDAAGLVGFPRSTLRNNAADIRRLKARLAELRADSDH